MYKRIRSLDDGEARDKDIGPDYGAVLTLIMTLWLHPYKPGCRVYGLDEDCDYDHDTGIATVTDDADDIDIDDDLVGVA